MDTMQALVGQTLGQYTIVEQIGEGGMATVFKAYQPSLNRDVALKILPPRFAKDADFTKRFLREAEAIAKLNHPNILPVYDTGQDKGYSYLAMRYVKNAKTLRDEMRKTMKPERIIEVMSQIAGALDHAHQAGIIHRDIKPSNILMDGEWALLSDFGLAKMTEASVELTGTGVGVGTPAYMSPEQGRGDKVDHRTDIYALGIMLFEMLTGQIPHKAETPVATVMKRLNEPLPMPRHLNPNIPEAVERVILKTLAIDPKLRFNSAGEMVFALRAAFGDKPEAVLPDVSKDYIEPAKTQPDLPDKTQVSALPPVKQLDLGVISLPLNAFGFSVIGGLILLVLCGVGTLIYLQLQPERSPITWEYVLDVSQEMNSPFPDEEMSKWESAQQTLNEDLALVPEEINVGLRVFGHAEGEAGCTETNLVVEPNPGQIALIQDKLGELSPTGPESPLTEAMVQAFNDLELSPDKRNALIVLTDGADSCDPEGVEQVATFMERLNIRIDTYIVGLSVDDPAAVENLQVLASASDGVFLPANSSAELEDILETIQDNLRAERPPQAIALAPTPTSTPVPAPTDTPTPIPPTATPTEVVPVDLTAEEAYAAVLEEALAWQPDAVLSEMSTSALDLLDAEGTSTSWSVSFWSPSAQELNGFIFVDGVLQPATPVALPNQPNLVPFDESVILDTKQIYEIADAAGGSQLIAEGYEPMAGLTQYPLDETVPTWYVNYVDPETFEIAFDVIIDARSGEVIQALDTR